MRTKRILYILLFSSLTLAAKCQNNKITKIEFTSLTRGFQKQVFISPDSVTEIVDGRESENKLVKRKLAATEWDALVKSINNIALDEIPQLQSPTSRRAFDGANHSAIVIHVTGKEPYRHSFDDESPHKMLQPLMEAIKKVQEK